MKIQYTCKQQSDRLTNEQKSHDHFFSDGCLCDIHSVLARGSERWNYHTGSICQHLIPTANSLRDTVMQYIICSPWHTEYQGKHIKNNSPRLVNCEISYCTTTFLEVEGHGNIILMMSTHAQFHLSTVPKSLLKPKVKKWKIIQSESHVKT